MNNGQLNDLLDEQSRHLPADKPAGEWLARFPKATASVVPLLQLAREITGIIVPIRPRAAYRADLHRSLMMAARQQQAERALLLSESGRAAAGRLPAELRSRVNAWAEQAGQDLEEFGENEHRWVVGAAVVGSAISLVGILAYVLRLRGRSAATA